MMKLMVIKVHQNKAPSSGCDENKITGRTRRNEWKQKRATHPRCMHTAASAKPPSLTMPTDLANHKMEERINITQKTWSDDFGQSEKNHQRFPMSLDYVT